MPYLAFDLDAKKKVPLIARAAEVTPAEVGWAMLELWEHVWSTKKGELSPVEVCGCIGSSPALLAAFVAFGFLEATTNGFRVKGSDRYLRVSEGRKAGAATTNAKRWGPVAPATKSDDAGSLPVAPATPDRSLQVALTPSTEHRAPSIESKEEEAPLPREKAAVDITPPDKPASEWLADDFWRWFQSKRIAGGFVAERGPPGRLSYWWSLVMMQINGDVERLKEAVYRFGEDPYWQQRNLPWAGFQVNWPNFVPREVKHASA